MKDVDLNSLVKGFFEHKIIEVSVDKPFVLASGRESPVYIDHRRIFSVPQLRKKVAHLWAQKILETLRVPSDTNLVVAGTATAGIAPGYALAEELHCGFVYVRSKPKEHGTAKVVEGVWTPGSRVLVVDDMVTTGGSILDAVQKIRDAQGQVVFASSITRHDFPATLDKFTAMHIDLVSVFKTTDIFDTAYKLNLLGSKEMRAVMGWLAQWQSE